MQKKANWDLETNLTGKFSDYVEPEDERKAVQKRTFTRWMNVFLQRCDPPVEVHDLFTDIQDGRILMALLEELSGCKLLYRFRSSSHRIFRLNNISKALAFLDDRHVKLFGIDASNIADGVPCAVLNLVWNIILYFQVKEVTGGLQRRLSSSLSSLSMNSYPYSSEILPQPNDTGSYTCKTLPSKGRKTAGESKYHGKAIKTLLKWVQRCTSKFGVEVHDFGKSWRSGMAFLAMVKSINPDLVDLKESLSRDPKENTEQAFMIAHQYLNIPPLLEPEDVTCTSPDEQSIITYVSMFLGHCSGTNEAYTTDTEIPETPTFGSPASVSFGGTIAHDPKAQALLFYENRNSEQLLWKGWTRKSSGSPCGTSFHTNGAVTAHLSSSSSDVFSPCHHHQDHSKPSAEDSPFSLSSEEGLYSMSALDSDEEDAYSYILDLNKEVFLPYNQLKSQVANVEEETVEELNKEPIQVDISGFKDQESSSVKSADFDLESQVRAQSMAHRKFVVDKQESSFRQMTNNRAGFDIEPDDESAGKEEPKQERAVRRQSDGDYGEKEATETVIVVTCGYDETDALVDKAEKTMFFKMASWQKEVEEDSNKGPSVKGLQVKEMIVGGDKEATNLTFDEGKQRKLEEEKDDVKEEGSGNNQSVVCFESCGVEVNETLEYEIRGKRTTRINAEEEKDRIDGGCNMEGLTKSSKDEKKEEHTDKVKKSGHYEAAEEKDRELKTRKRILADKKVTTTNHPAETTLRNDTDGGDHIHDCDNSCSSACRGTRPSLSEGGLILQSLAASCDITPIEFAVLLVLWILLYCCLILPQINL